MSVLKLPLLVVVQQKLGELVISITSYRTIISLENALNYCIEKCGYGNFDHRYYVSPLHLYSLLGLGNFKQVVCVCVCSSRL
jgi:hypothetical protein